jgi:serine/threonine-protein kinase
MEHAMLVGEQIGPFVVDKELGSGAMGAVYRAFYSKLGKDVAIKIIATGLDANPKNLARFEREAAILKVLDHPNIVRLYGTGRYHKKPFYVMEYVAGETLEGVLKRRDRFTWEEVVSLGRQICSALQHAHQQGIVHRDLKPANIMIMPDGTVKLMDFGIAKGLESTQLTTTNCTVGTAAYMSPEQCRGERVLTHKSDLYSLGVMFYELLTGRKPFTVETTLDMFLAHTGGKFERPSRLVLDIPIWLDTLVCQQMEKDPEQRPLDANTVAQALERVQEKVEAQRSAGVEVLKTPRMNLPPELRKADAADREALQLIRAGAAKKKVRKRTRPIYERAWFVLGAIAALLAAVAAIVYVALQPPNPEQLYAKIRVLMQSENSDNWDAARSGPITDYLRYYGNRDDEQSLQVHQWADKADRALRERQLGNRFKRDLQPENEAERHAFKALEAEKNGQLDLAIEAWERVTKYRDDPDNDIRSTTLVAQKHLDDLQQAAEREKQLETQVVKRRQQQSDKLPESEVEAQGVLGTHFEAFGEVTAAVRCWTRVRDVDRSDPDWRQWNLLALKHLSELKGKDKKDRLDLLQERLAEATKLQAEDRDESRLICLDMVILYSGKDAEPAVVEVVKQARRLLKKLEPDSQN